MMLEEENNEEVREEKINSRWADGKERTRRFALDLPHSCADEFRGKDRTTC